MKVEQIMTRRVLTLPAEADVETAWNLMKEYDIRHLPVVQDDRLIGLVTERDLRGAVFAAMYDPIHVRDMMVSDPLTVQPETQIEDAARLVYKYKLGCLPVVDGENHLQGIVTVADMLAALIEVMGFLSASSRLDVRLPEFPGALEEVCRIIGDHGGHIIGISSTRLMGAGPIHLFRLKKIDLTPISDALKQNGFEVVSTLS